jgi:hypothetical protein
MKTNSVDLLDLTTAESPWRSWLLRSWIIGSVLLTSFCVFKGLEASAPKPATTRQITVTEEVRRTKRMDEVQENDFVLARDEHGTEIGPRRVVQVFRRTSDHLRLLTFEARDGTRQTIKTTDEHPFGCADSLHFIPAGQLPLGHQVPGPKGELQTLVATTREEHPEGIPVFNFEVEGFHTYFVSFQQGALLVHNTCNDSILDALDNGNIHVNNNVVRRPEIHHIGSRYDDRMKALFDEAGLDIESAYNKVKIPGHQGPHGDGYNDYIYQRLRAVTDGKSGPEFTAALKEELLQLRWDLKNTDLGDLVKAPTP